MENQSSDVWSTAILREISFESNVLLLREAQRLIQMERDNDWPEKVEKRWRRDAPAASDS